MRRKLFFYSLTILINARIDLLFVICSLRVTQRYDICILNITSMSFIYLKHVIRTAFNLVNPLKNRCLARVDLPKQPLPTIIFILEAIRGTDPLYSLIEFTKNHLWCFTQPTLHFFYRYLFAVCEIFKSLMLKSDRCEKISEYLTKLSESHKSRWRKNRTSAF